MNKKTLFRLLFASLLFALIMLAQASANDLALKYHLSAEGSLQPANWQLRLEFDQPVSILEVSKRVSLKFKSKNAEFKIWNATELGAAENRKALPPERQIFILRPSPVPSATGSCRIVIDGKLASANNKARLNRQREIIFDTALGTTVLGAEPYFNSPTNKGVRIYLSELVKDYQLKKKIRIFPPVGMFSVDRQYTYNRNEYLVSGKFVTGRKYQIEILGGSTGEKEPVLNPYKFEFTSCGPKPEIRFATDRNVLELKSRQMIPLSFANVGNFRCQFMKIPAFFGPWFDSLAVFPDVEEKRPTEVTSFRLGDSEKKILEATAADLDNMMLTGVNRLNALKALEGGDKIPGLADFLAPEFVSNSEGYMGSDNPDQEYFFSLPLDSRAEPEKGGSVVIRVNEADVENGQQATRLFQLTDLSITYKFSRSELLLWVTSIQTGKPLGNISVMLVLKDDVCVFPGKTDRDGLIRISQDKECSAIKWNGNQPEIHLVKPTVDSMLIAAVANEADSSFVRLSSNRFLPSSVNSSYIDQKEELGAKGHVFTERGVYKQGETVFWKATLREYIEKSIRPVTGEEVSVRISNPRGEEIFDETLALSEFGTVSGELKLASYAPLGQYNLRIYRLVENQEKTRMGLEPAWDFLMNRSPTKPENVNTAGQSSEKIEILLTSTGFQVQEFEPPRHYVEISTRLDSRKVKVVVGQETEQPYLECRIKSLYYTGGPLRHAKVQWTAHLAENDCSVGEYPLYQFGHNDPFKDLIESGNSVLDKNGELVVALPVSQEVLSGLNRIEISATVLDVDARPSTGVENFSHKPEYRVGIAKLPGGLAQEQEFPVQILVLDQNGKPVTNGQVQLEIMRKRWFYTQKRDASGGIYYNWASGWTRNQRSVSQIKGDFAEFDLILAEGGDYMLQATYRVGSAEYKAAYSFHVDYSYASFDDLNSISRVRSENEIILLSDKAVAAVNDKVKIRYSLPAVCEYALITTETDAILSARVVRLERSQGEFIETIGENCRPNVFVSLTAPNHRSIFPVYTSQMDSDYPRTYFGFANIKVQNTVDKLNIEIAPEKAAELVGRPGEDFELNLKVTDKNGRPVVAEVALCVVDEAILSLTGYVTPALETLADFMLPLKVFTGDLRTSLISQELFRLISTRALTGGDGGVGAIAADLDVRKDFRPVAYWNPALIPDDKGFIKVNFKLPDSMTAYRVYAVAVDKGAAFVSKQRNLKVTREFYIEPGLPRFLTAGDQAIFPLNFNNKTDQQGNAEYQVLQAENLTMSPMKSEIAMTGFSNSVARLELKAENGAGNGKILLSAKFNGLNDAIEKSLPIKPSQTIINRLLSGHFKESIKINAEIPAYVAGLAPSQKINTFSAKLNVSTSRWSRIIPTLHYLLKYPYGCLEQTSSAIIPLTAMRDLIKDGRLPGISIDEIDAYIKRGIDRLLIMQRPSGGFSYWPGEYHETWWGSQYAVLALTMAKKSGIEIDQNCLDKALSSVKTGLFSRNNDSYFEHGFYAMAVVNLAMNDQLKPADLETLKNKFKTVAGEASPLMLLAEAFCSGSDKKALAAKLKLLKPEKKSVDHSWYYSSVRLNAFSLMALIAGNGDMKQADQFAGELLDRLNNRSYWNSTADTGIALLALSQYFRQEALVEKEKVDITLKSATGEKTINVDKYGATIELTESELIGAEGIELKCADKVLLNWTLDYTYPDLEDRTEDLQNGFIIEKTVKNLNGSDEIRVGDLVRVVVEFEDKFHQDDKHPILNYMALEDPIPAGFIAVNSSLKNDSLPASERENEEAYCGWENGAWNFYADHQEIQNDRFLAFKNRFWSGKFRVVYYLRAVCEGDFKMKPTRISLMYDPEFYGMTTACRVKILPVN